MMSTDPKTGRYSVPTPYEAWVERQAERETVTKLGRCDPDA